MPSAGLDFACREAAARGLRLSLRQADADALLFADESFDDVLSWNVIFHGTMGDVGRRLAEIWRVLKPGGLFQGTMPSRRHVQLAVCWSIAPDTFIRGSSSLGAPTLSIAQHPPASPFSSPALKSSSLTQEEQRRGPLALAHPRRTAVNGDGRASARPVGPVRRIEIRSGRSHFRHRDRFVAGTCQLLGQRLRLLRQSGRQYALCGDQRADHWRRPVMQCRQEQAGENDVPGGCIRRPSGGRCPRAA